MPEEVKTEESQPEIIIDSDKDTNECLYELQTIEDAIAELQVKIKKEQAGAQRYRVALEDWMRQNHRLDPDALTLQYPTGALRLRPNKDRVDVTEGCHLADYPFNSLVKISFALDKKAAKLAIDNNEAPAFVTVIPGEGHSFSYQFNVEAVEDCADVARKIATDAARKIATDAARNIAEQKS